MLVFAVSEEKNHQLRKAMENAGIREEDLDERFVRSSGAGGQHLNKTSTCVYLLHRPTGLEVKCMKERSQSMNRFFARRELLEKIAALNGQPTKTSEREGKIRKSKANRARKARKKYDGGK